jgi:hypothetical protein
MDINNEVLPQMENIINQPKPKFINSKIIFVIGFIAGCFVSSFINNLTRSLWGVSLEFFYANVKLVLLAIFFMWVVLLLIQILSKGKFVFSSLLYSIAGLLIGFIVSFTIFLGPYFLLSLMLP